MMRKTIARYILRILVITNSKKLLDFLTPEQVYINSKNFLLIKTILSMILVHHVTR